MNPVDGPPADSIDASELEPRQELQAIASALRGYVEWHDLSGTSGFPRAPRSAPREEPAASAAAPVDAEPKRSAPAAAEPPRELGFNPDAMMAEALREPARAQQSSAAPVSTPTPKAAPRALDVIAQEVASCTRCGLASTRKHTVFERGNPQSALCFIGEAPGADEDASGIPFVGAAGRLLDKMIAAMGLDVEKDVYVCNIIKCRPPGNRRPTPDEMNACRPFFEEQIAKVSPKVIVALGNTAVSALIGTSVGITKLRGQWKTYKGSTLLMPTYHPSFLLRPSPTQTDNKREAWSDLQAVMKELGIGKA